MALSVHSSCPNDRSGTFTAICGIWENDSNCCALQLKVGQVVNLTGTWATLDLDRWMVKQRELFAFLRAGATATQIMHCLAYDLLLL